MEESDDEQVVCVDVVVDAVGEPPVDIRYPTRPQPPPEIKADPGRLKIWQAEQDKLQAYAGVNCDVWEGKGCDHQTLFCCYRPAKHQNRVSCSSENYPPGVSKY